MREAKGNMRRPLTRYFYCVMLEHDTGKHEIVSAGTRARMIARSIAAVGFALTPTRRGLRPVTLRRRQAVTFDDEGSPGWLEFPKRGLLDLIFGNCLVPDFENYNLPRISLRITFSTKECSLAPR